MVRGVRGELREGVEEGLLEVHGMGRGRGVQQEPHLHVEGQEVENSVVGKRWLHYNDVRDVLGFVDFHCVSSPIIGRMQVISAIGAVLTWASLLNLSMIWSNISYFGIFMGTARSMIKWEGVRFYNMN